MSTYKKKNISISKYKIEGQDINTTISDNIIYYDIENKGLLNLIKFNKNKNSLNMSKSNLPDSKQKTFKKNLTNISEKSLPSTFKNNIIHG